MNVGLPRHYHKNFVERDTISLLLQMPPGFGLYPLHSYQLVFKNGTNDETCVVNAFFSSNLYQLINRPFVLMDIL